LTLKVRRGGDLVARYGGEEFAVLLPNTDAAEAQRFARALCQAIEERDIAHTESAVARHVTVSIGVGSISPSAIQPSLGADSASRVLQSQTSLIEAADRALYAAKAEGRNRVSEISLELQIAEAITAADIPLSPLRPA
jgi:diguanylate cyclase (GGDEF)-like protein